MPENSLGVFHLRKIHQTSPLDPHSDPPPKNF